MRILLSTAPARYWQTTNFMLTNFPPLGLAACAAAVSPPHDVHIVENARFRTRSHNLFHEVKKFRADVVAFTNNFYPDSVIIQRVCRELKERYPGIVTVVGGQAPSFLPDEYVKNGVDYVVLYEAETTFKDLIQFLDGKGEKDRSEIEGICYLDDHGEVIRTRPRQLLSESDFDNLPMPRRDLLPYYGSFTHPGHPSTAIETVRGCPYHCKFCTRPTYWGKHRHYSNDRIVEEIAWIKRQGFKELLFTDDTMAHDIPKMHDLMDRLLSRGLTINFGGAIRADTVTKHPDLIKKMRRVGLFFVNVGFESYSRKALRGMSKATTIDLNRIASETLRGNDILILGSHVYGAPGQTEEDLEQITADGMEHSDFFRLNMYTPQVGSVLFNDMRKRGRMPSRDPENFNQFEYLFDDGRDPREMKTGFVKRQLQYYFHPSTLKSLYTLGEGTQAAKHKIVRRAYVSAAMFVGYRTLRKVGIEIM